MWLRISLENRPSPQYLPQQTVMVGPIKRAPRRGGKIWNIAAGNWKLCINCLWSLLNFLGFFCWCCVCCTRRKVIPFSSIWELKLVCAHTYTTHTHTPVRRGKSSCVAAFVDVCNVDFECTCLPVNRPRFFHGCIHLELGGSSWSFDVKQFCKSKVPCNFLKKET